VVIATSEYVTINFGTW